MSITVHKQFDVTDPAGAGGDVFIALPSTSKGFRVIGGRASIKVGNPGDGIDITVIHRVIAGGAEVILGTFTTGTGADAGDTIEYVKNTTANADRTILSPATDVLKVSCAAMGAICTFAIDLVLDEMARLY